MAGKLTLIKKEVITTATSSITMTGINTNDEHWLVINNLRTDGGTEARLRLTVSGSANTSAEYDYRFLGETLAKLTPLTPGPVVRALGIKFGVTGSLVGKEFDEAI